MIRPAFFRLLWRNRGSPTSATSPSRRAPATWWLVALAWAVIWAQMAGLVHRIDHAGATFGLSSLHGEVRAGDAAGQWAEASPAAEWHSCVLFDGLCLADSLPTALAPALASGMALPWVPDAHFASWHALFVSHFLSRGPPAAA